MKAKDILVKAKRIDWENFPKEYWWVQGNLLRDGVTGKVFVHLEGCELNESDKAHEEGCLAFVAIEVIEETVSLFTGKVVNERRLYENDILKDEEENDILLVSYDEEECRFVLEMYGIAGMTTESGWDETAGGFKHFDTCEFSMFESLDFFTFVGNRFDNPKLLEEYGYEY